MLLIRWKVLIYPHFSQGNTALQVTEYANVTRGFKDIECKSHRMSKRSVIAQATCRDDVMSSISAREFLK